MKRFLPMTILLPVFAGVHSACSEAPSFDRNGAAAELAKTIAIGADHVTAAELSDWIIKDKRDYALLDIREAADFTAGHIEGARNVPLAGLMSDASLDALPAGRKVVVYSNGTAHASQAALLLRLVERDAYALLGGFNHWLAYLNDPQAAGAGDGSAAACRLPGRCVPVRRRLCRGRRRVDAAGCRHRGGRASRAPAPAARIRWVSAWASGWAARTCSRRRRRARAGGRPAGPGARPGPGQRRGRVGITARAQTVRAVC